MNQEKIGKFIADTRKDKKMTQTELAEKLGVTDRSVSNWENGKNMPDLSLFKPLCEILDITINELLSGEKLNKSEYQEKLEENIIRTIDYTSKNKKNKMISEMLMLFGFIIIFMAFTIYPTESSWGAIHSELGLFISLIGFIMFIKNSKLIKKIIYAVIYLIIGMSLLMTIDYINVKLNKVPPRFSYLIKTSDNMIIYKSAFCNVYRINRNTKNEYYIVDYKKIYNEKTIPIVPFNRDKSGIENIIKFKNQYVGNNSNDSHLIDSLPLSEYGYVFEIKNMDLIIDYNITDWYINENNYLEKCLLYNSVSIFYLIENVKNITFNFSGNTYKVSREEIEINYPNYKDIKENTFNKYVENKINDNEFVIDIFNKIFE